ncbi:MAG: putative lipoprotein YajG [Rickettsiales bacterium]|jgi:uncharacterized lipoprotein YajG
MKKIIILVSIFLLSSCINQKEIEAKARYQAETGSRINEASKNTESLFDEMK